MPLYMLQDLWAALHLPTDQFDDYLAKNGPGTTWEELLSAVRGPAQCGVPVDGEWCVLAPHSDTSPHYGASDVGRSKPLPRPVWS